MANRLAKEQSPYLLQHKDNPVDWWPWCEEAFEAAASEDKPVLLSIGYATCHWCHVMERESFEDHEVAALMNRAFINIKVDREERPDIDAVYMPVCQILGMRGGWPLTVIMTPEKRPFFAGTYFPKRSVPGRIGMLDLVPGISERWRTRRTRLVADADLLKAALVAVNAVKTEDNEPGAELLDRAYRTLRSEFDAVHGGFGGAPKFPAPSGLRFLLRYWKRTGRADMLQMVGQTLMAMRQGGIYDHVGWGFHRYATDTAWTVPHFEKMLYDQAILALTYTEAYQATSEALFEKTVRETLCYVLRDMTDPQGGFYSAEDADSEGEEGKYYVWTYEELCEVLHEEQVALLERVCNVRPGGNFRDEATGRFTGANILYRSGADCDEDSLEEVRLALFAHRRTRVPPLKDDKVLTDWNGLMIAAMARAARVFDESSYVHAAERAAAFVEKHLTRDGCYLIHRWRRGSAKVSGFLDDYVYMTWGLLELYETTFKARYLETALSYSRVCRECFRSGSGGYYLTSDDALDVIVRTQPFHDGPLPSANAVMAMNLMRLGRLTSDKALVSEAWSVLRACASRLRSYPVDSAALASALAYALGHASQVVIAGKPEASDTRALLRALGIRYLPDTVTLFRPVTDAGERPPVVSLIPALESYSMIDGAAAAYVCQDFACQSPTTDVAAMLQQVGAASPS